ncbi:hypothetical protein WL057_17715 [Vibrio alginolyticus]|uniref:hypothetical protein n=1 Tax=Vibrio alginolyticus TaxID=663 RepID=UPI00215E0B04|nr:hypothetical protein [Vibrio alginolyticus]MCS0080807.1 hypothetical protein [Vibrio alginolyticus]
MAKSDGWDLYFQVARRGTEIAAASAVICFAVDMTDIVGTQLKSHLGLMYNTHFKQLPFSHDEQKMLVWGILTLAFAYIAAFLKSLKYSLSSRNGFSLLLDIVRNNPLEYFVVDAALTFVDDDQDSKVVCVTLSSGKVYIGFCIGGNNVTQGSLEHIEIIPIRSGFRENETQNLVIVNDYEEYFLEQGADIEEFVVVLPTSEVVSYQYFDLAAYEAIQPVSESQQETADYTQITYPTQIISVG